MRQRFPMMRKLVLLLGDMGLLVGATYLAALVVFYDRWDKVGFSSEYVTMLPVMLVVAGILLNINGLFSMARKLFSEVILSLSVTVFNLFIIMMAASFFFREFEYSRSVLVLTAVLQFVFLAMWKYSFWYAERISQEPKEALLVGGKSECLRVMARLSIQPQLNYKVRYVCSDCAGESWRKVLDTVDLIIVCADMPLKVKAEIVHACHTRGKQVFLIPDVYEVFCSGVVLDKIDDIPVLRPQYLRPTLEQRSLKRMLDIVVSGVALFVLSPIMLLVMAAIKMDSPGPVVYSQIRTGRDEKTFPVYKFRSMRQDAEAKSGPVLAAEKDPRITKVGNFLRATRLDELPQLVNVLLGDMSLVGPRPERPFFVEQFKKEIPEYVYRHNVKPGITGWAQVYGKYNTTAYNKLIYDLLYIQKCNAVTDLIIMLQTVRVLVTKSSTEGVKNTMKADLTQYEIEQVG